MNCRFDPNQGRITLCCLYVAMCGSKLRCVTMQEHSYLNGGVLNVQIVFPAADILMYRSSPLVSLDNYLNTATCLFIKCPFGVSQASDLTLLVGYVAYKDFNLLLVCIYFIYIYDIVTCYSHAI